MLESLRAAFRCGESLFLNIRFAALNLANRASHTTQEFVADLRTQAHDDSSYRGVVERMQWVRRQLRRSPTWKGGHLYLARSGLQINDVATAYAATQILQKFSLSPHQRRIVFLVLARCYLRRGHFSQAEQVIIEQLSRMPNDIELQEELAAALIGMERYRDAFAVLAKIADRDLSAGGHAAKKFVATKSGESSSRGI